MLIEQSLKIVVGMLPTKLFYIYMCVRLLQTNFRTSPSYYNFCYIKCFFYIPSHVRATTLRFIRKVCRYLVKLIKLSRACRRLMTFRLQTGYLRSLATVSTTRLLHARKDLFLLKAYKSIPVKKEEEKKIIIL